MATNTLSILKPSVNNLSARIFIRAAGLEFEELDVWGKKSTPEFLAKDPADLTPLLEEAGLPRGSLWESCAIMQYLCNKHGLDRFYPTEPAERAMVDSAMFYLIGTFYPLLARATYPTLGFAQYAGEAATADVDDATKTKRSASGASAPMMPAASLSRRIPTTKVTRRSPNVSRSDAASARAPAGLCAPSSTSRPPSRRRI